MVREHGGDGEIVVPPTIHALLQARIDSLDGDVRVVMERGSVEGEVFHRGAVAELSPALVRGDVGSHLTTLVRKELIRSTASTFPEDEGYPLPPSAHPRRGVRVAAEGDACGAARALRRLARAARARRARRDRRLPPRAGAPVPSRARPGRSDAARRSPSACRGAARRRRARCPRARGLPAAADAAASSGGAFFPRATIAGTSWRPISRFALWDAGEFATATSVLADGRAASDPGHRCRLRDRRDGVRRTDERHRSAPRQLNATRRRRTELSRRPATTRASRSTGGGRDRALVRAATRPRRSQPRERGARAHAPRREAKSVRGRARHG